jgi:hypothetical protein
MDILHRFDQQGYAIPWTTDDEIIECGANDPEYGEPESWPEWTDIYQFEPLPEDRAWLSAQQEMSIEPDWDEYSRWSAWQDALEAAHPPIRDQDIIAAGLAVG